MKTIQKQFKNNSKILAIILLVSISTIGFYACKKERQKSNGIPPNKPYVAHSSSSVDIRATDSLNSFSTIIRKIELINREDGSVFDTFLVKVEVSDKEINVYDALKLKNITGTFEIISNGQTLIKSSAINGVESGMKHYFSNEHVKKYDNKGDLSFTEVGQFAMMANDCTWGAIHNCVSNTINDMGWVEYGLCLASAPECYVGMWAICSFDICRPHLGTNQL